MGQIQSKVDFGNIKDPAEFIKYASQFLQELQSIMNGSLELDKNFLSQTIEVKFPQANTDVIVRHNLNRTGLRFFPIEKSVSCDVYHGQGTDSTNTIFLRCTAATTVTLVLL